MNKLSTTLTMTLLLGTTLNAANEYSLTTYNSERGAPTGTGALVVAGQSLVAYTSNQTPTHALAIPGQITIPTSTELLIRAQNIEATIIWAELTALAERAQKSFCPEALVEIKHLQQELLGLQRFKASCSKLKSVTNEDIQASFCEASNNAKKHSAAERAVVLWRLHKKFLADNNLIDQDGNCRRGYYVLPDTMLEAIYNMAIDQATLGNIDYLLSLWELQREVLSELTFFPKRHVISSSEIQNGFKAAAKKARDLDTLLTLWNKQEAFLIANPSVYCPKDSLIATIIDDKIQAEIASAQRTGNTQRAEELTKIKYNLLTTIQTAPVPSLAETRTHMLAIKQLAKSVSLIRKIDYFFSAVLQPYGTEPQVESALDKAAKIVVLGHGNFQAYPEWRSVYKPLREIFSKALANGDAITASIAFSYLREFSNYMEESPISSPDEEKLKTMINDFISAAHETNNPFRLVAAFGLFNMRGVDFLRTPVIKVVESFAPSLKQVRDLNLLNYMNALIMEFDKKILPMYEEHPSEHTRLKVALTDAQKAYEDTKTKLQSLEIHTGGDAAAAGTSRIPADELSVRALVAKYGEMIDVGSLLEFQDSFNGYYRIASLKLHPDKNTGKPEEVLAANKAKLATLQKFKAWVDELTEAQFAASPKV